MNAEQSLGEIISALLRPEYPKIDDTDAMVLAGQCLASEIAAQTKADYADVWDVMTHLRDDLMPLLDSRPGWAALSVIVAANLGAQSQPVFPSIH